MSMANEGEKPVALHPNGCIFYENHVNTLPFQRALFATWSAHRIDSTRREHEKRNKTKYGMQTKKRDQFSWVSAVRFVVIFMRCTTTAREKKRISVRSSDFYFVSN